MADRPQRERRAPVRLEDYEVGLPPSLQHRDLLKQRLQASFNKLDRNKRRAIQIIDAGGSDKVLHACKDRVITAWTDLQKVCGDLSNVVEDAVQVKVERLLDDLESEVEEFVDELQEHAEERAGPCNASVQQPGSGERRQHQVQSTPHPGQQQPPNLECDATRIGHAPGDSETHETYESARYSGGEEDDWRTTTDASVHLVNAIERITSLAEVPATPPMVFTGDAGRYLPFIKNFEDRVGSKPFPPSLKLAQLVACTTGKARDAVEVYVGQEDGYTRALAVLKHRFGQPYHIVRALMEKIQRTERIQQHETDKLQRFSDQLCADTNLLKSLNMLREADTQTTVHEIFSKLPPREQGRWVEQVNDLENRGAQPTFEMLVDFIKRQANRASHPVFKVRSGTRIDSPSQGGQLRRETHTQQRRRSVYSVQTPASRTVLDPGRPTSGNLNQRHPPPPLRQSTGSAHPPPPRPVFTGPPTEECCFCERRNGFSRGHTIAHCPAFALQEPRVRHQFVVENRLCFVCLGSHFYRQCQKPVHEQSCRVRGCNGRHHSLLHQQENVTPTATPTTSSSRQAFASTYSHSNQAAPDVQPDHRSTGQHADATTEIGASLRPAKVTDVLLRVVPLRVTSADGSSLTTYGLLDTGATCSMVAKRLANELKIRGKPHSVNLNTVVARNQPINVELTDLLISPINERWPESTHKIKDAHIIDHLAIDEIDTRRANIDLSKWPHLRDLPISDTNVDIPCVSILIGEDVPAAQTVLEAVYGTDIATQPYGVKTPFGWCVAGPVGTHQQERQSASPLINSNDDTPIREHQGEEPSDTTEPAEVVDHLEEAVNKLWNEERHGFANDGSPTLSFEDRQALQKLEKETYRSEDGHYVVPLLWRESVTSLPNNFAAAARCLSQLKKKFAQRPEFASMYRKMMRNYIDKEYARELSPQEVRKSGPRTFYLPHQGEENPNKPGKVRVVFNAAHQWEKRSLNNSLVHGPDLNNSLSGTLLRFRQSKIAIQADIAEMFHQVRVPEHDADSLRFLWWKDEDDTAPTIYRMERHIFGATDSPSCCAYALQRTARDFGHLYTPETTSTVSRNMYVDDLVKSCPTTSEATHLARELISLLERGGFTLTKFVSNSREVLDSLPPDKLAPPCTAKTFDEMPVGCALGIKWDIAADTFGIKFQDPSKPVTRRGCLSVVCSVNDPFGLVAPLTMIAKRIVQDACRRQLLWDDPLPEDLTKAWTEWKRSLDQLNLIAVARCYQGREDPNRIRRTELHHFCDASETAYGTVTYLRLVLDDGTVHSSFIIGKSRTAPLRYLSMPRLELQAAVVAARVDDLVRRELDLSIDDSVFWSDSSVVLQYVSNNTRRFKSFVANRVEEIRDVSEPNQWRYCPTDQNPADLASRGANAEKLARTNWLTGPEFLKLTPEYWPPRRDVASVPTTDPELKCAQNIYSSSATPRSPIERLVDHYSTWNGLIRAVAWLRKILKGRISKPNFESDMHLSPENLLSAAKVVLRFVQESHYHEELVCLKNQQPVPRGSDLAPLCPRLKNGMLRVGGRISAAPVLSFEQKHQIIVPKNDKVTNLLIRHYHATHGHASQQHTLNALRQKYWVIGGKSTVKCVLRDCIICRKLHARLLTQVMSSLPEARLTSHQPPFSISGCDAFGPFLVKRGRTTVKRYGLIFTCFSTRAIHLELLERMDTDSFVLGLLRFVNRRGTREIWCDNGSNFISGSRQLRGTETKPNKAKISETLTRHGITWRFQTPYAPHMSGVWERLVRSVKSALKAILGNAQVTDEVLRTVLVQVEGIINSRPITPVSDDPEDLDALTPNHFLLQQPYCDPTADVKEDNPFRRRWRAAQYYVNQVWNRWRKEYLPMLQGRQKWRRPQRNVRVGDLVLLAEDNVARAQWPLGRITSVYPTEDGYVRSVDVRTANGTYKRPIVKLCLLEGAPSPVVSDAPRAGGV